MRFTFPCCARSLVVWATTIVLFTPAGLAWPRSFTQAPGLRSLIPFARFDKDFQITAGKDRGRVVELVSRPDPADSAKTQITFGDYAAVHLVRNPNGGLSLERLDLIKSRSYVLYDPPLPVLPKDTEGGLFRREADYRMFHGDSDRLKRSGRVTHIVQRIAPARFTTPAGPVDGIFVEMEHRMEMEYLSELRIDLGLGLREGEGPVFGSGRYKITRLGLFSEIKNAAAAILSR